MCVSVCPCLYATFGCCESVAQATDNRHSNSTSSHRPQPLSREQSLTHGNLLSSVHVCVSKCTLCVFVSVDVLDHALYVRVHVWVSANQRKEDLVINFCQAKG